LTFQIRSGDRVHLTGDNGVGKSTLVQLITGKLQPQSGQLSKADFSYLVLDQDYSMISDGLSLYEQVQQYNNRGMQEHELKSWLTHCQFDAQAFDRKCEDLSGGEKMKLSLCCLAVSLQTPDMLILDEPANNLDIKSLEVLATSIRDFKGTLLLISHDAHFVETVGITGHIKLDINFSLEQVRIS
jgi:ATPase subunit of ABC transporter with duplicated ATPase domains